MVQRAARNATLEDLAALLKDQQARKVDMVVPASKITSREGLLVVQGADVVMDESGVTQADGVYRPTIVCDEGIADKFKIPLAYVRRLRDERVDLFDANVNGWLHGRKPKYRVGHNVEQEIVREAIAGDERSFLLRCFRPDEPGGEGIARAFLSDSYKMVDDLDMLTAALSGVEQAGVQIQIDGCDLTDRRMYVRILAPEVKAYAESLLQGYRSPFLDPEIERQRNHGWTVERGLEAARREGMALGGDVDPVVFAGFVLSNSETGCGAWSITPRLMIKVCKNGLTITADALRGVHLGAKMDEGVIRWSDETQQKNLELVTAKTRDAVATFLDVDYVQSTLVKIEEKAGVRVSKPDDAIKVIGKRLSFDQATIDGVLDHFIRGGQMTAGGVLNAVTSFAQTIGDADKAMDIEAQGLAALEAAAALS